MVYPLPSFVLGPHMRIQNVQAVRDGVVYIGSENNGQFTPNGTGFLVSYPIDENHSVIYAVTAVHVLSGIAGNTIYVRLNRKDGGVSSIAVRDSDILGWHENDLALVPVRMGVDVFDYKVLDLNHLEIERARSIFDGISFGDEVFAVGLYTSHYGLTRNVPIVRIGHVALLPGEPVRGPGGYVSAYLIELKSIGGLSGSPVYLNPPPIRIKNKQVQHLDGYYFLPIGVLVGYHVVESKEDQVVVSKFQSANSDDDPQDTDSLDQRNTGFGVVIPIDRVLDMLKRMQPSIKASIDKEKSKSGFRAASASASPPAIDENPTHLEDFKSLLNAAAKTQQQDD